MVGSDSLVYETHPTTQSASGVDTFWNWILCHIKTLDTVGGIKPFPDYSFLYELAKALFANRILIVAKSRQMLATWMICAWILYRMIHDDPGVYILLSKGNRETKELIKRLKIMVWNLPLNIRDHEPGITVKAAEIACGNDSRLIALPATEDTVRMHSPTAIFWDEMAFTPYSEGIWSGVRPALDTGGSFYGVSTPNGTDNIFFKLWNDDKNHFGKHSMHWKEHPLRDQDWKENAQKGLSTARWKQEYEIDFQVLENRVYSDFNPTIHLLPHPYRWDPHSGRTARGIDFGYRHPYVIWAQLLRNGEIVIFDEWEGKDATIEDLERAIRVIDEKHGLTESKVSFTAVDPAGAARSDTGISSVDRLKRSGFKLVWRSSQIMTGIEHVSSLIKDASGKIRLRFSSNVTRTIHHLKHYRWDSAGVLPLKDNEHDHAMDALRYLIINMLEDKGNCWTGAMVKGGRW